MGNTCSCCASPAVMSPSHGEGSSTSHPPLPVRSTLNGQGSSLPSPSVSIESLMLEIQKVNSADNIDLLIMLIEDQLERIEGAQKQASVTSSASTLDSVTSTTSLAAKIIDTISTEAEKLKDEDIAKEMGNLALKGLKMVGEAHWIFIGLSVAACALERCVTMRSNASMCRGLLKQIVYLSKDLKQFKEAMPEESERLCQAVQIVVEGAVMCCEYLNEGGFYRYFSATTIEAQINKTKQSMAEIRSSLGFSVTVDVHRKAKDLLRFTTMRDEESPLELLDFEPGGIEEKVAEVKELLDMEGTEPALAIVLCGFGGVGKSTLAASVIQNLYGTHPGIRAGFKFSRVILNDKCVDEISHIKQLQQDIIYDLGGGKKDLRNLQEGYRILQKTMLNKACLVLIDNIVDKKYVQMLLPKDLLWFNKPESKPTKNMGKENTKLRIVITSRVKNLGPELKITCKEYNVLAFSNERARSLLRETILEKSVKFSGESTESALIDAVADACRGVPILLSVYGKHLKEDTNPEKYNEALDSLHQGNLARNNESLRQGDPDGFSDEQNLSKQLFFVYSKLSEEDREAFLDICKYFCGWEWNLVCKILDKDRVESLQRRMLINKSESGVLIVHDVLRSMGEEEANQTRISNYRELLHVLEAGKEKLKGIKGISVLGNESVFRVKSSHLNATCRSLRVLMLGDWVRLEGPSCDGDFKKLRYLSVGDTINFPFEDASKLQNLRALFNRSKHGMSLHQLPPSLRIIFHQVPDPSGHSFQTLPLQNLSSLQSFIVQTKKLVKLPDREFGFPKSLVDLQLNCCRHLPKDFSILTALERLTLDRCDMEVLPQGMGKLTKLKHLSLQHCTKLAFLAAEEVGKLSSMTCLRLCGCALVQYLPDDLGELGALEELSLRDCENLRELPQGLGGLCSLRNLDLTGCISLKKLPDSFAELPLETLTLQSLLSLDELPHCIGNMPCLFHLKLISCISLATLPDSFVHLKCLQSLEIIDCSNLVELPPDFCQLSVLSEIIVKDCHKLEELPRGFQSLPTLKKIELINCSGLVSLPSGFGELERLEFLLLKNLLFTSLPDGFGKLRSLDILLIESCYKLETLSGDFETLESLTQAVLVTCPELDGAAMEIIARLQQCYFVNIARSAKLMERWQAMRQENDFPMVVLTEGNVVGEQEWKRAAKVGLLFGNCVKLDNTTQQLIERSTSMPLEERTTVIVIALPLHMGFHHDQLLQRLVQTAMEKQNLDSSTARMVRIVYVKRVKEKGETTAREQEEEKECFRQVLKSTPFQQASCAITSTHMRLHRLITFLFFDSLGYRANNKLSCCTVSMDFPYIYRELAECLGEEDISDGMAIQNSERSDKVNIISNTIGNLLQSICSGKFSGTAGPHNQSRFAELIHILKESTAYHLTNSKLRQVLKSNVVAIFIGDLNSPEYLKLEHIYKEVKSKGHNFEVIWIPLHKNEIYGLGTYTRATENMSWTVLPNPNMVKVESKNPHCIIFDQQRKVADQEALSAMMSWGAEVFPFTQNKIGQMVSTMHARSSLDFLFNKLDSVHKGAINNKLVFLYAEPPSPKLKMKSGLEKLQRLHNNVQIIYVGHFFVQECDGATIKEVYEDVIQTMHWPKLSFEDMVTFWYCCKYWFEETWDKLNLMIQELKLLSKFLYIEKRWLIVLDGDGVVTRSGYDMVKMLCNVNAMKIDEVDLIMRGEVLKSIKLKNFNQVVRSYFKDIVTNHPKHLQHPLEIENGQQIQLATDYYCDSCGSSKEVTWEKQRRYRCHECDWDLCEKCWVLYVKREVKNSYRI